MRIFVTHICPKDKLFDYGLALSASYFNYNLIEGGGFDKVYSIYPGFVKGKLDKVDDETFEAVYSSWRTKGKMRQKLSRVVEQIKLFHKIPRMCNVWYYNLNSLNVVLILLLMLFKPKVKQNLIILDYTPDFMFDRMVLPLINRMHSRISLSVYPKFNRHNFVCLPGVVPATDTSHSQIKKIKREFLLSGALNENITMLGMILDAFSQMPDCKLHLSGILTDCKDKVTEYTKKYPNIIYHGKMPYENFMTLLSSIPFSFNTRNPLAPENQCNFPSKVIEALLYNRIILSTIDYPQLKGIDYLHVGATLEQFKNDVQRIANMLPCELIKFANQEQKVKDRFNAFKWFEIMTKLENQR